MEITESRTLEGLPRVDWIQVELAYRPISVLFQLGIFFVVFVSIDCVAAYIAAVRMTDANHMWQFELNVVLGLIFVGPFFALPTYLICVAFYAYHQTKGLDRIGETAYCRRRVRCFMFLRKQSSGYFLCFIAGDTSRALCSDASDPYESIRLEGLLSFSVIDENAWEGVRVNPDMPQEKLIIADRGERGTVTIARHYGSQAAISELRTVLQRNFLNRWPLGLPAATPGASPQPETRSLSDDVI